MDITLSLLVEEIQKIIQDAAAYDSSDITFRLNQKQQQIAAGIKMPDKSVSPPLPDLYKYGTVTTSLTLSYVSLPTDYQRNMTMIVDSAGNRLAPPPGGDYYAFNLFVRHSSYKALTEAGSVYRVAIKGTKLYYQGIPTTAETIGLHYYRKPTDMVLNGDSPDGIPEHLQLRLLKHGVLADIFGESIEDGQDNVGMGYKFHTGKFFEAMQEFCEFVGIDAEPQFYGAGSNEDGGVCD